MPLGNRVRGPYHKLPLRFMARALRAIVGGWGGEGEGEDP